MLQMKVKYFIDKIYRKVVEFELHFFLQTFIMWHYIKGVAPPKHKLTTEERKEHDQAYEKQCKRSFVSTWKVDRPWLRVKTSADDAEKVMFCDFCIKAGIPSDETSFIKGCTRF